ncbi:MAG TPA: HAD family hydrolase [Candidatus Saccharimonadia bacterium]
MIFTIPGAGELTINTIILDLNGTISVGGQLVPGVKQRLHKLKSAGYRVVLFTGNTRNDADELAAELGIEWRLAPSAHDKAVAAQEFDPATAVSIGNGRIDLELMEAVKLSIVTLQAEGVHVQTLMVCDIVIPTITDALDLFLDDSRLIATLRK